MKVIEGGVCAAKGFMANGVHCGIRHNRTKRDLALIYSQVPATAAPEAIVAAAALRAAATVREIQVSHVQAALRAAATAAAVLWAVARRVAVLRAVHVAVVLQDDEI